MPVKRSEHRVLFLIYFFFNHNFFAAKPSARSSSRFTSGRVAGSGAACSDFGRHLLYCFYKICKIKHFFSLHWNEWGIARGQPARRRLYQSNANQSFNGPQKCRILMTQCFTVAFSYPHSLYWKQAQTFPPSFTCLCSFCDQTGFDTNPSLSPVSVYETRELSCDQAEVVMLSAFVLGLFCQAGMWRRSDLSSGRCCMWTDCFQYDLWMKNSHKNRKADICPISG